MVQKPTNLCFEHMTPPHEEMMTWSPQLWLFSSGDHEMSQVDRISQICVDVPHMQCSFCLPKWFIFRYASVKTPCWVSLQGTAWRGTLPRYRKKSLCTPRPMMSRGPLTAGGDFSSRSRFFLEHHIMKYFEIRKVVGMMEDTENTMNKKSYKVLQVVRSQFLSGTLSFF